MHRNSEQKDDDTVTEPTHRLRVVVATPLSEELCALIEQTEPRLELVREQDLLPPMRHAADFAGDPSFRRTPEQQARFEALVDTAEVLYGIPDVQPAALARTVQANPALRWVQIMAAGGGGQVKAAQLDDEALARVAFTTGAGVHGGPLAEFAVFGVLAGAKTLPRLLEQQRKHEWTGRWAMGQVSEQTVLVWGLGGIGSEVVAKLAALGATVIGVSRREVEIAGAARIVQPDAVPALLGEVDAIVTTLPGTAATEKLIGASTFDAVKRGATIVNVGRGNVIDEDALIDALRDGRIGFAALDVTAVEPLAESSPLWDLPNALISPHTAALNDAEDRRLALLFAENATRFLDNQPLVNRVDTVEFY